MVGKTLHNFRIISELGKGRVGVVYLAEHMDLGRRFAVKSLSSSLSHDSDFRKRFYRNATDQALLDHPNIVQVTDFFEKDGVFFLVTAYVDGQDLRKLIKTRGKLKEKDALSIFRDVLKGLQHAHNHRVVHGDIKPSNILIDKSGIARITDFGIAVLVGESGFTSTDATVGSSWYISPEQIQHPGQLDPRTDIYSSGILLYEMLAGHVPFDGETYLSVLDQQIHALPPNLHREHPEISEGLSEIVLKAMAKNPAERFHDCTEFLQRLPSSSSWTFWSVFSRKQQQWSEEETSRKADEDNRKRIEEERRRAEQEAEQEQRLLEAEAQRKAEEERLREEERKRSEEEARQKSDEENRRRIEEERNRAAKFFFSYARTDSEFVLKLAENLRSIGTNLWLDQLDIPGGTRWDHAVEEALKASPSLLVVLSPDSVTSDNVMDEVSFGLETRKTIVPILYKSCDIPFRLRRLQYIDFTAGYESGFKRLIQTLKAVDLPVTPPSVKPIPETPRVSEGQNTVSQRENPATNPGESGLLDPAQIISKSLLVETPHGRIEEVFLHGSRLVLKKTRSDLVDVKALQKLENQKIAASFRERSVTIVTPLKVWEEENHICELMPYYEGLNLHDLIERNKYRLCGGHLGMIYDCGFRALSKLHEMGLLHRDLTPDNMKLMPDGDIVILDISFCCHQENQQCPVSNPEFVAPEQALGKAVRQSDWYSLTSVIYFLANGHSPARSNSAEDLEKAIRTINLGQFFRRDPSHHEVISLLLNKDVRKRPSSYAEILLRTGTRVRDFDIYGVIDLGGSRFMILAPGGITIGSRLDIVQRLKMLLQFAVVREELKADIESFLAGGNPWLMK